LPLSAGISAPSLAAFVAPTILAAMLVYWATRRR